MQSSPLWSSLYPVIRKLDPDDLDLLRTVPVFEGIPDRGLRLVRSMCHVRQYKESEHVFRAGDPGVGMYIILEGSVEIYREENGKTLIFAILNAGDFFGELALLEDLPRSASARARSYCRMLGFYRPDLQSIVSRKPRLGSVVLMNMARLIGYRLIRTNQELERASEYHGDPSGREREPEQRRIGA